MELPKCLWVIVIHSYILPIRLNILGSEPLHIWLFTLDDLASALQHTIPDLPCPLLAEIHSNLIYNLRTVACTRHSATLSLFRLKQTLGPNHQVYGITIEDLLNAMDEVGNNWERVPLRHAEGREGWEDALIGCLKDVSVFLTLAFSLLMSIISMPILTTFLD